jgi:hypothetical protein
MEELSKDVDAKADLDSQMRIGANVLMPGLDGSLFSDDSWWPKSEPGMVFSPVGPHSCNISANPNDFIPEEKASDFLFGRYPNLAPQTASAVQFSAFFPVNMSTESLYPEESSIWTDRHGIDHTVTCFVPGINADVIEATCPNLFVAPIGDSGRNCIMPCPVQSFTSDE